MPDRLKPYVDRLKPIFGGTISMPVDGKTREWTPFPGGASPRPWTSRLTGKRCGVR